jgi:uncharacterized protein YyaL (SSP411 family)
MAFLAERIPLARDKIARDELTTAYVCTRGNCQLPTTNSLEFRRQLTG